MNFRFRTALTIVVLTAIALGGAFAAVSAAFNGLQRRQLDASLRSVAYQEAAEAPAHEFAFSEGPGPAANDVGPLTKYGIIFDRDGRVLSATAPFDVDPPSIGPYLKLKDKAFDLRFRGSHLRAVLVAIPQHPGKVLLLATDRDDLDGDEAFLHRAMLVAFAVALAWTAAIAYWMGGRLTRAHQALAQFARQVASGDLAARVQVPPGDPEVAQLSRDIHEMVARLGELLNAQQRFVAHAAHELRSPLASLYGELQQALRKQRDADGYKAAIEASLLAARRLTVLAEDLLTLARVRADSSGEAVSVPVEAAIAEACAMVNPLARERAVRLSVTVEPCWIPDRTGDASRVIRNLLENAIRHSPSDGVVSLEAATKGGTVCLTVTDEGPGVLESERVAIFEPFFRSKGSAPTDGAGLGLGIAREIARAHGGDVTCELHAGNAGGARFVVSFPAAAPAE